MRSSLVLPLLALTTCTPEPPGVTLDGAGCEALALEVLDPAVLPGWTVHTMVSERVDGDAVWTLATAPGGALMLKPWPDGPALDLSGLGEAEDFSLLPGRHDGESWLLLGRQDDLRVWRLGAAADGEVTASSDLGGVPGPGGWTYQLLLVGETPYLLAASTGVLVSELQFQLTPLDPQSLTPGASGPPVKFSELCEPTADFPCTTFSSPSTWTEVHALAVTEPGSMTGAAAMFGLTFTPEDSISPAFITLQVNALGSGQPPALAARFVGLSASGGAPQQRGRLAADGDGLYVSALLADAGESIAEHGFAHAYAKLTDRTSDEGWLRWDQGGPLLQIGRSAVLFDLVNDHWEFSLVKRGGISTKTTRLDLPTQTQLWSAAHEQLFVQPPTGPAMRLGARCAEDDANE